jgi:hypothetical protein
MAVNELRELGQQTLGLIAPAVLSVMVTIIGIFSLLGP